MEPDLELVREFCENSLAGLEWLEGYGIEFKEGLSTVTGGLWQRGHSFASKTGAFAAMQENIEAMGGELMLNTHADTLIVENGRVAGVNATYKGEIPVTLHANKAVILTSGGFGANKEMADEYNNYWPAGLLEVATDQIASTMGDGITMALAVGADTEGMGYTQLFPAVNVVTNDIGPFGSFDPVNTIYVNVNGERFVNEYAERDVMAQAVLEQPGAVHFQICDDTVEQDRLANGKGADWEKLMTFVERDAFMWQKRWKMPRRILAATWKRCAPLLTRTTKRWMIVTTPSRAGRCSAKSATPRRTTSARCTAPSTTPWAA